MAVLAITVNRKKKEIECVISIFSVLEIIHVVQCNVIQTQDQIYADGM